MSRRTHTLVPRLSWVLPALGAILVAFFVGLVAPACGRSSLEEALLLEGGALDGSSVDGGGCRLQTCSTGCCDGAGACRAGTDLRTCGALGQRCIDCAVGGFDVCDVATHACGKKTTTCNSTTCSTGCCRKLSDGTSVCLGGRDASACGVEGAECVNCLLSGSSCDTLTRRCSASTCNAANCKGCCAGTTCFVGTDPKLCGSTGGACEDCAIKGQTCVVSGAGGRCEGTPTCGPANCGGCCQGNSCVTGADNTACGKFGQACTNCSAFGRVCAPLGSPSERTCIVPPPCSAATCPTGCCVGNTCVSPPTNAACGTAGAACTPCGATETCVGGKCTPTVTCPMTCAGCCQGNSCFGGFLNTRCGSGGATCADCTPAGSCNTGVVPRTCIGANCPAPYPACGVGITTPAQAQAQNVCDVGTDIADLRVACAAGPQSVACQNFLAFLKVTKPACLTCLSPFTFPFAEGTGVFACVAPFVTPACNRATGCTTDCVKTSCGLCPAGAEAACRNGVTGGQCNPFVTQAATCTTSALLVGPGAFCNPANPAYAGNYGAWIAGVGTAYCGP